MQLGQTLCWTKARLFWGQAMSKCRSPGSDIFSPEGAIYPIFHRLRGISSQDPNTRIWGPSRDERGPCLYNPGPRSSYREESGPLKTARSLGSNSVIQAPESLARARLLLDRGVQGCWGPRREFLGGGQGYLGPS